MPHTICMLCSGILTPVGDFNPLGSMNTVYTWNISMLITLSFQVEDSATEFGAGLVQLGIETGQDSFVGVYSRNCPDVCVHTSTV